MDVDSGEEDDDDEELYPTSKNQPRGRGPKRRKTSIESDDQDAFIDDAETEDGVADEGKTISIICMRLKFYG